MGNGPLACQGEPDVSPSPMAGKNQDRQHRLAEALRENLRRRKAQARSADQGKGDKEERSDAETPE